MALLESKRDLIAPPNLFTYFRGLLTLPVCLLMLQPGALGWWGFSLFALAVTTDKVDGWLAKRNNGRWTTNWGKLVDPIVDKLLVLAVLGRAIYLADGTLRTHLIIILTGLALRELVVGMVKARQPVRSAAEGGRFSMVVQSLAVALLVLPPIDGWDRQSLFTVLMLYGALGASLCSGWLYVVEWWALRSGRPSDRIRAGYMFVIVGVVLSIGLLVLPDVPTTTRAGAMAATLASCLCMIWVMWRARRRTPKAS